MVFLGFGYSLVPAAMWPSVPKIVPAKVLGTAFALVYWVQNLGLLSFKMLAGNILTSRGGDQGTAQSAGAAVSVEIMFIAVCLLSVALSFILRRDSSRHPEMKLDAPSKA
jgi:Na+/melibiose symporter-like transporter